MSRSAGLMITSAGAVALTLVLSVPASAAGRAQESASIRSQATGWCLESDSARTMYTTGCNGSNYRRAVEHGPVVLMIGWSGAWCGRT